MRLSDWINSIRWKYFTNNKSGLIFKELMKEFEMVDKMTENKRYYRTNVNLEDNNHEPYYNIRDRKKEGNNVLFMVGGKYTSKEIVDKLNEQDAKIREQDKHEEKLFSYFFKRFEEERGVDHETFCEMWFDIKYGDDVE